MTNEPSNISKKHWSTTTKTLKDDWHWPAPQNYQCEQPPTIKAVTPLLFANSHPTSPNRLQTSEGTKLQQFQTFHPDKGLNIPLTIHFFQWMGIEEKYHVEIQRQYRCYGLLSPFTDLCKERAAQIQLSPLVLNSYESCQYRIYFENCKLIISRLGKAWHIGMSTHAHKKLEEYHSLLVTFLCKHLTVARHAHNA